DLDDAHPAHVHRSQGLQIAERRGVDALGTAGVQDGGPFGDPDWLAVDGHVDEPPRRGHRDGPGHSGRQRRDLDHRWVPGKGSGAASRPIDAHRVVPPVNRSKREMADWIALAAVCPSPQIEASRITWAISSISAISSAMEPLGRPPARRRSASSCLTVPTRHGTHWPQDAARKKAAMRSTMSTRSTLSSKAITTPEPSV